VQLADDVNDERVVTVIEIIGTAAAHRDVEVRQLGGLHSRVCELGNCHRPFECRRHANDGKRWV
jgi:hypothetical protein